MDGDEELVFLDLDAADDPQARPGAGRPRQRWLWLLLAAVLVGGLIVQGSRHTSSPAAAPSSQPTAPPTPQASRTAQVTVTGLGQSFLGETGGWTLFGRSPGVLVRIDPARGEITRTVVPGLQSGGPVSFVPATGEVIIRPIDIVPSYAVPDGRPAQPLPAAFGTGGPILPGPDAGHVWVAAGDGQDSAFVLSSLTGRPSGPVIQLPDHSSGLAAVGDGAGYLLVPTSDGVYQAQPGGYRQVSPGSLLATGSTGWLVAECDRQQHCQRVLIDRATGQRRILGPESANGGSRAPYGVISPDGRTAAIFDVGADGHNTIELLDLRTGSLRPTSLDLLDAVSDATVSWSPDGNWLFAIDVDGGLAVLAPATGQLRSLPGSLPPLTQLAVRADG